MAGLGWAGLGWAGEVQVSTGCCITQGGVTAGDGDGEDCDADTGNWFVVSSTLPSLHWGHLQRDQNPDVAQMSLATQTLTQAGGSYITTSKSGHQ